MNTATSVVVSYEASSPLLVANAGGIQLHSNDPVDSISALLHADERGAVSFEEIKTLEDFFKQHGDTYGPPLVHRFCNGLYAREITMPAGAIIVSKMHRQDNVAIISKGRVTVWSEEGMQEICAPFCMITKPGTKRVLFIHEDCVWTTVHATDLKDTDLIEKDMTVEDCNERLFRSTLLIGGAS